MAVNIERNTSAWIKEIVIGLVDYQREYRCYCYYFERFKNYSPVIEHIEYYSIVKSRKKNKGWKVKNT